MTLEAEILHFADHASAKTASMAEALGDAGNFAGEALGSAKSLWQLERRLGVSGEQRLGRQRHRRG